MGRLLSTTRGALVAAALVASAAVAAPAATAAPGEPGTGQISSAPSAHHRWAESHVVLGGRVYTEFGPYISGNRHQLHLVTDNGVSSGYMRSYYCPSGASVSPDWASSRCTYRQRIELSRWPGFSVGRVSSTSSSATQKGNLYGTRGSRGQWPFEADLTLYATGEPMDDGDGTFYSFWREADRIQGRFQGTPIVPGSKRYGWIGGYGPA